MLCSVGLLTGVAAAQVKLKKSPDYASVSHEEARRDIVARIKNYEKVYEPIDELTLDLDGETVRDSGGAFWTGFCCVHQGNCVALFLTTHLYTLSTLAKCGSAGAWHLYVHRRDILPEVSVVGFCS